MGKERDIRRLEAVEREFGMDPQERREFGDYIEQCKRMGEKGSGQGGGFTYSELRDEVAEFRGERQ